VPEWWDGTAGKPDDTDDDEGCLPQLAVALLAFLAVIL
jgi:hypothetical protein